MDGTVVLTRTVVKERDIVGAEDGFFRADDLLEFLDRFGIFAFADDVV